MKALLLGFEPVDYTIAYVNGLARTMAPVVVLPRARYQPLAGWFDPAVDLRLVDWPRHRSVANLAFLAKLTRLVLRERPDLVHLLSNTTLWLNAAAPLWRRIPLVTTVHDVVPHPGDNETARLPDWSSRLMARQSGDIVVHGEALKRAAIARFGKSAATVHVLQHPAIARYAELARREGLVRRSGPRVFTVLMFGRIFAYKGLDTLVRAEARMGARVPDLRIVIAGRGDDPRGLAAEMGDPARYDIRHGFVSDPDVAQLFLDADLVVLPYTEASQSGVLHLAATFGKPVIATDVGELRATVEPNGLGLVVRPADPGALADAIATLAGDPQRLAALGAAAKAWSEGPNAAATVGADAAELYRHIVERDRKGHACEAHAGRAGQCAP
ncbi:glycosyltransferase family 4 protein [Acuticoccus kandeliae]|uniref:glycosyltransferase family 4 protein n=1 Tax=Acuticoccus kandeliae TaxID=2073160 RepID=UPI000D3E08F6|nr:glycosyltransferase family 4 protein [Acuticoccus kandeliae]